MRILYDYQAFIQRIGGVSRYAIELINHLSKDVDAILPPILTDNVYIKQEKWQHRSFCENNTSPRKYNVYKTLNIVQSIYKLRCSDYDIFHPLFVNPYFINHTKKPVVITIHDLNHDKFPDLMPNGRKVIEKERKVCERADAIIAISHETKDDLMKFHDVPEEKIVVVYHGMDQSLINSNGNRLHEAPYLLYIGGRNRYKNFKTFLKGFSVMKEKMDLVCTGSSFSDEEKELIKQLGIQDRIYQSFVSDSELYNLLCNAEAFVYPSLAEGFGIPILEAFRCSCPCIVSDIQCFHEVGGDAVLYFNPNDADSIAMTIDKNISNGEKLAAMRKLGRERLRQFTWEKCAANTELVYKSLI